MRAAATAATRERGESPPKKREARRAADAANTPKFDHQWLLDVLYMENGFPDSVITGLHNMGYNTARRQSIGRTEVIEISPSGTIEAVADGRGDDGAEGF